MVDVKRVWSVHEALDQVDMTNESSESLKNLLKQCTYSIPYLKCSEVRFVRSGWCRVLLKKVFLQLKLG